MKLSWGDCYKITLIISQHWFRQWLSAGRQQTITWVNSLAPGKFEWNFRHVIFKQNLVIDGWGISCEIAIIWMSLDFSDYQSTLVQVMAWCRQATSHYLSQCWPRSLSPYGITRPQWVNVYPYLSHHIVSLDHNELSLYFHVMMTSWQGNTLHITNLSCRESTGRWWIPCTICNTDPQCFLLLVWTNNEVPGNLIHYDAQVKSLQSDTKSIPN